jgi:hypothetical protein
MSNPLTRHVLRAFLLIIIFTGIAKAQTVAILDQGHNTTLNHRGSSKFVTQHCISYSDRSRLDPVQPTDGTVLLDIFQASLCNSPLGGSHQFFTNSAAFHPRTFFEPITGTSHTTSKQLDHARIMSDAIWGFSRNVFHQHFQVFGFAGNQENTVTSLPVSVANKGNYKTRGGNNIVSALNFMSRVSDPNLGAVVIAKVAGDRINTPPLCTNFVGQESVDKLRSKGIVVVAGLNNNDIPAGTKTWPNCLNGVINVGRTDGFAPPFIGIGSNGIDYFAESAVPYSGFAETGNSFAAPKVAAAFALLHKAHPTATVEHTYSGVTKRRITRFQISNAISKLAAIIEEDNNTNNNPNDDIHFDPTNHGIAFGGQSSDEVEIDIDFSILLAARTIDFHVAQNLSQGLSTTPNQQRDVILEFTGIFDESFSPWRKFRVKLNNNLIDTIDGFDNNQETIKNLIINRNLFQDGNNTIRIEPLDASFKWGLKDISVKLIPAIPLTIGTQDTNQYGYLETPTRYTGLRFTFNLLDRELDRKLTLTGWDIDQADETEVFLNGSSLGYLETTQQSSFGTRNSFILPTSILSVGENLIELQQLKPSGSFSGFEYEKWAVKDILVEFKKDKIIIPIILLLLDE